MKEFKSYRKKPVVVEALQMIAVFADGTRRHKIDVVRGEEFHYFRVGKMLVREDQLAFFLQGTGQQ